LKQRRWGGELECPIPEEEKKIRPGDVLKGKTVRK